RRRAVRGPHGATARVRDLQGRAGRAPRARLAAEPAEALSRDLRERPGEAEVGNPVSEPVVLRDDGRRVADRLRKLVPPPRADRQSKLEERNKLEERS